VAHYKHRSHGTVGGQGQEEELSITKSQPPSSPSSLVDTTARKILGATGLSLILLIALARLAIRKRITQKQLVEWGLATAGGLLSSSCCVIQLYLNFFSLGCAGFAALDRFRPFFLFLTGTGLATKTYLYDYKIYNNILRSIPSWLIAIALSCSPHVVRMINQAGLAQDVPSRYHYKVKGLKCEACANRLKRELEALPHIDRASVAFAESSEVVIDASPTRRRGPGVPPSPSIEKNISDLMDAFQYEAALVGTSGGQQDAM